jgi:hypothetical protein
MVVSEAITVSDKDKHVQGHGTNRGIIFNDKGSGPMHLGPTDCFFTFDSVGDNTKVKGYCTFGDVDGDRVFTDFSGASQPGGDVAGMHDIMAGTGKYSGITGTVPWRCKYRGSNGELECTQQINYKLP